MYILCARVLAIVFPVVVEADDPSSEHLYDLVWGSNTLPPGILSLAHEFECTESSLGGQLVVALLDLLFLPGFGVASGLPAYSGSNIPMSYAWFGILDMLC